MTIISLLLQIHNIKNKKYLKYSFTGAIQAETFSLIAKPYNWVIIKTRNVQNVISKIKWIVIDF